MEIKNQGDDAFKPEIYGDLIIVERRITESSSSTVLKDHKGLRSFSYTYALFSLMVYLFCGLCIGLLF